MADFALSKLAFLTSKGVFMSYVIPFEELRMTDVEIVGGKNASLGEMISQLSDAGVRVPGGFATTAEASQEFLEIDNLGERINERLRTLDHDDVRELTAAGAEIRQWIIDTPFPAKLEEEIRTAFSALDADGQGSFAVRSSATAEDLPDASFAGQQESYLNVVGIDDILEKIHLVFASLYNDRAISYRVHKRSEEHTSELQSRGQLVCRLLLEKKYSHHVDHI